MTVSDVCIQEPGYVMPSGYVQRTVDGVRDYAHRHAYRRAFGPIPTGCEIDHLCRNRSCANPEHLEAVPHRINLLRGESFSGKNARKTECSKGHPLTEDNLYRVASRPNSRICAICHRARQAAYDARRRAK